METATLDPLADVASLVELALAAEERLRPHLLNPPSGETDDIAHLNRVTLILGRMINIRKALRALRDGDPPAGGGRVRRRPDAGGDPNTTVRSVAADLAAASAMIDRLAPAHFAVPAGAPDPSPEDRTPSNSAADSTAAPPAATVLIPVPPVAPNAAPAVPAVSPAHCAARAMNLARAVNRVAREAARVLPHAMLPSPFGIDDLHPQQGPMKLSPALLNQLRLPTGNPDTS